MDDVQTLAPAIPRKLPRHKDVPRQRGRGLLKVLVALTAIAGIVGGVFISLSAGEPEGSRLSIIYALIPLPLLWAAYWWLDRYEPEPLRYKVAAFVWGGVGAVAIALSIQLFISEVWHVSDENMATFVAPLTEEPAKCVFLVLTLFRARRVIDGFLDGVIYAGIVGLGFAFIENIGYYAASYLGSPDIKIAGAEGVTTTFIVRGVFSPFAHPLFTTAFGIGLGLAVSRKSKTVKWLLGLAGLAISIGLHGLWNGSLTYGGGLGFLLSYLALATLFIVLMTIVIIARNRQVKILERSLLYVSERGWIHPAEIPYLSQFSYRKAARRYAKHQHGKVAGTAIKRYQRLATDMAFLHDAVMTGRTKPGGIERTYALLDSMYALRPHLRFPPALQNAPHQHR